MAESISDLFGHFFLRRVVRTLSVVLATIGLFLSTCLSASTQELIDVDEMGDIWVVTIDNSGSMVGKPGAKGMKINENKESMISSVFWRLSGDRRGYTCLSHADFSKDRFLFLYSGFSFEKPETIGRDLDRAEPLHQSFIHGTDDQFHSFRNARECARYIKRMMEDLDYGYGLSFVSQIRTFSVVHAVNLLKEKGENDSFNGLKLLTITDDADQNDQWRTDYRNMKTSPKKFKQVNDTTIKYIFNPLNGKGEGVLNEVDSNDKYRTHIWLYSYRTRRQNEQKREIMLGKVWAADGRTLRFRPNLKKIDEDSICFFHLDSIVVNDTSFRVDASFVDAFQAEYNYENALKKNHVAIKGYVQVKYNDPIYGLHFKKIPFIQHCEVNSQKLQTLYNCLIGMGIAILLGFLLFFFCIRPHTAFFTIYSSLGRKTRVRIGQLGSWKGESIPLLNFQENASRIKELTKRHKNIDVSESKRFSEGLEILICSRFRLGIMGTVIVYDTSNDIGRYYDTREALYSELLREQYERSVFFKLYEAKKNRRRYVRRLASAIIDVLNCLCKKYYYLIRPCDQPYSYIYGESVLKTKRFAIEYSVADNPAENMTDFERMSHSALVAYYKNETGKMGIFDVLVCRRIRTNCTDWVILQLNDDRENGSSLRSVRSFVRFKDEGQRYGEKQILAGVKKAFPHKRVGLIDIGTIDNTGDVEFNFNITDSSAPGYIVFVENTKFPRAQIFYSPVSDFMQKDLLIKINEKLSDGFLFLSPIPIDKQARNFNLAKKLSENVIRGGEFGSNLYRLVINSTGLNFQNNTIRYY